MERHVRNEFVMLGRIKASLDAGYTREEIMKTLGISECTFRAYKRIIDEAEANKNSAE